MMMSFSLSHLTVLDVGPPNLVSLAASAGFREFGLRLVSPVPGGIAYPLRAGTEALRETRQRMKDLDVRLSDIEVVRLAADTDIAEYLSVFEAGAELGARRVCVNIDDADRARVIDRFGALCDLAAPFDLALDVEFMIWRPVATLEDAVDVVASARRPNGFILVDALHLIRSGGQVSSIAAVDRKWIGSVQLCDAPFASPPAEKIIEEARGSRLLPGQGELPLLPLLAAIGDDVPIAVEVPMSASHPDLSPLERASRAYQATERLLRYSASFISST